MSDNTVTCKIEHHAVLFALLSKYATLLCSKEGTKAIQKGMIRYGNERGARMAANALAHEDPLTTMASQAYGEWAPDFEGQIEAGQLGITPTLRTYVSKCAWCDAWNKHHLLEYGKYYCVNVDNAVYQGFRSDFVCRHLSDPLSFGGTRCEFDWGHPLTEEENQILSEKRVLLGTTCMKDFTFHTAHILYTLSKTLIEELGDIGNQAVHSAVREYERIFGTEYLAILDGAYKNHPAPIC